jgi:uncharacterized protein YbaP (TraB family)
MSAGLQQELLDITLDEIEGNEVAKLMTEMVSAWQSSDLARLERVLKDEESKLSPAKSREFHDKFLGSRNALMAKKIEQMLRERKTVFVAVGAGHVLGSDGLLALLRAKGYRVRQL